MDFWKGKVAVVTGASAGIGAEIARTLTEHGIIVVGLARRNVQLQVYVQENQKRIVPLKCDVSKEQDILDAFRMIEDRFGGVDIMINNAGVSILSPLTTGKTEDWKEVFDINVMAMNICTREALKTMRKLGDNGHIININSTAGHKISSIPNLGIYNASKYAVTAITESLRNELRKLGSNIRVTSLSPGLVYTDMVVKNVPNFARNQDNNFASPPTGYLKASDISKAVVAILSLPQNVEIQEMTIKSCEKQPVFNK